MALDPPSPLLPDDEVMRLLREGMAELGAAGGGLGGGLTGASGGRSGARWASRRIPTVGATRSLPVPLVPQTYEPLRDALPLLLIVAPERGQLAGMTGSGAMNLNPVVVQAFWDAGGLHLVAYAQEGLIKQHSARKAVDRLAGLLGM